MINVEVSGTLPTVNTDLTDVMAEIRDNVMTKSLLLNFEQGGRPQVWQPLKKTGQPSHLFKTGRLKGSILGTSGKDWAESGTSKGRCIYAAVHQFGWPAKNIAERKYIMFQEEDKAQIKRLLVNHIFHTSEPVKIGA